MISDILPKLRSLQQKYFVLQVIPRVDVWLVESADEIFQGLDVACHMLNPVLKKELQNITVEINLNNSTPFICFQEYSILVRFGF